MIDWLILIILSYPVSPRRDTYSTIEIKKNWAISLSLSPVLMQPFKRIELFYITAILFFISQAQNTSVSLKRRSRCVMSQYSPTTSDAMKQTVPKSTIFDKTRTDLEQQENVGGTNKIFHPFYTRDILGAGLIIAPFVFASKSWIHTSSKMGATKAVVLLFFFF